MLHIIRTDMLRWSLGGFDDEPDSLVKGWTKREDETLTAFYLQNTQNGQMIWGASASFSQNPARPVSRRHL